MYANVRGFQLLGEQYVRERPDLFSQGEVERLAGASEVAAPQ